ncbi:MAG: FHA domain-containing protein [Bacteroidaceae bacterium]|nr:FHA domain-containing protein [Bacteroidaceae bacterium]
MSKTKIEIGRNPQCDICVDSSICTVSGSHSTIEYKDGIFYYSDHSTNGTVVNGKKVKDETVEIKYGDSIALAGTYELDWAQIRTFFPISRETKIIGVTAPKSRKTEFYTPGQESRETPSGQSGSRETVNFKPQRTKGETADAPVSAPVQSPGAVVGKWNWGAFLCTWLWAACHRKFWPLLVLLVSAVPYIGQAAQIMLAFYLGLNGSRIAWECGKYSTVESYCKAQKAWTVAGVIILLVSLVFNAAALYTILSYYK